MDDVTDETLEDWIDHPIVAFAEQRSDGTLLGHLETLSSVLNDLEEKFPGVHFDRVLSVDQVEVPDNLRGELLAAGVALEDVDIVAPEDLDDGERSARQVERTATANQSRDAAWSFADRGLTRAEMRALGVEEKTMYLARALQAGLTKREKKILKWIDKGLSASDMKREHGVSTNARWMAVQKRAYLLRQRIS